MSLQIGFNALGTPPAVNAIPDSVGHQHWATEQSYSDGDTADPFEDSVGSLDLSAVGSPTFNSGGLNNADAITLDGTDDAYTYSNAGINEPATIIWALSWDDFSGIETLYRDTTDEFNRIGLDADNNEWLLTVNDNTSSGGSQVVGDVIATFAVDDTTGILRVNGSEVASASSTTDLSVMTSASFYRDGDNNRRYVGAEAGGSVIHPDSRLTGSDLTDEEQRVEDEFNMSVL